MKKINWTVVSIFVPVVGGVLVWAFSVESRFGSYEAALDLNDRVQNLETLLTPLLVEYKVEQKLKELRSDLDFAPAPPPTITYGDPSPPTYGSPLPEEPLPNVRQEAESWANQQIQAPMKGR